MSVPLFAASLEPYHDALVERLDAVVRSGRYILGPEVGAFESEFAKHSGVAHCVGVANGTDALTIALRALGVEPGDEVVMPSLTFYATAEAAVNAGATPVFCDVDPETYCVTAETVAAAVTSRTRAIVPVHLFGNLAPVEELRAHGVPVLEDAAQAAGSTLRGRHAGSLGDAATFSFFPSKNLGGFGDGGAVVTDDDAVAERVRTLRFHGSRDKVSYEEVGYNSRLDELQAAILRVLLPELDGWCTGRRAAARHYAEAGLGELVGLPTPVDGADPAWHLYVIRHSLAERLAPALDRVGIGQRAYYRTPVHRQPAMRPYAGGLTLPGTEAAARMHLALPLSPVLSRSQAIEVVSAIRSARA